MTTRILLSGCLVLALAASAAGQPNVIRFVPVDVDGKIVQMANRALMVSTASEQTYTVTVSNQTQVRVVGMAEPDVLVPGACVRFIGTVDKKQNRVQEKIDALTIFVPDQTSERMLGVVYPNASAPPPGEPPKQEKEKPKIVGGPGAPGAMMRPGMQPPQGMQLPADNAPPMADAAGGFKAGHKGGKGGGSAESVEKFDIRGKISSNKAGRLTIMLPSNQYLKPKLYAELAETPKIAVDLTDWSAVKKGDRVHVRGRQANPSMVEATEVYIELTEPLSFSTKKGKKLAAGKTPAEKPGKSGKKPAEPPQEPEPKPPAAEPAAAPARPADEAPQGDKAEQILQVLQLPPAELQGKRGVKVALQGGQPEEFTPCKPEPVKNIKDKFGEPDSVGGIQGNMPGDDGQMKPVTWELWTYGNIKFFVDENRTARYYNYTKK